MKSVSVVAAILALATSAVAESPFAGTWKQNRDKTQFDSEPAPLEIKAEENGIRYGNAFGGPLDGSERPGLSNKNAVYTLRKSGERGFEANMSLNGKPVQRQVVEVSPDGKTLTISTADLMPRNDGKQPMTVDTYHRAGGEGKPFPFVGTWKLDRKLTKFSEDPLPVVITENGGLLTMSLPAIDTKQTIDLNKSEVTIVGAPYPPPPDMTQTVKKVDERSFERITIRGGRVTSKVLFSVSEDGKTMTQRSTSFPANGKPNTTTSFYERQ